MEEGRNAVQFEGMKDCLIFRDAQTPRVSAKSSAHAEASSCHAHCYYS